jgi:NAD(P)H-dependent FMN reductase
MMHKKNVDITVSIIDLSTHELPWFDNDNNPSSSNDVWVEYKKILDTVDSVIIVSPEW